MDDFTTPSAITIGELTRLVREFEEKIKAGTEDPERFLTLSEIEQLWGSLIGDTNVLYSDMLQTLIRSIDERELIRKKKRILGKWNPPAHPSTRRTGNSDPARQNHLFQEYFNSC